MALTQKDILNKLQEQYNSGGYKQKTDEELKQQAQQEYGAYYDQLKLGAQQQFDRSDLGLQQQKAALDYAFQKQQEAAEKEYNKVYSQADRQLLSRGMQRSSYGAQTLANIRQQQADVYMDLEGQLAAKGADIEAKRAQLGDQYAAQINQYNAAQAADELNRLRELQDREYERGVAADKAQNDFYMQLYAAINQAERDAIEDDRWEREFAEGKRQYEESNDRWEREFEEDKRRYEESKNPTSGGGGGGNKQPTETPTTPSASGGFDDFMNALNGTGAMPVGTSFLAPLIGAATVGASVGSTALSGAPSVIQVDGPVTQKFIDDLNSMSGKKVTTDNWRLQQAIDNTNKNGKKVFESVLLNNMKKQKK